MKSAARIARANEIAERLARAIEAGEPPRVIDDLFGQLLALRTSLGKAIVRARAGEYESVPFEFGDPVRLSIYLGHKDARLIVPKPGASGLRTVSVIYPEVIPTDWRTFRNVRQSSVSWEDQVFLGLPNPDDDPLNRARRSIERLRSVRID